MVGGRGDSSGCATDAAADAVVSGGSGWVMAGAYCGRRRLTTDRGW